ncbi:type IV toxin-antitoxin system AbiEi family antitoxin domain-containing protein [Terrabacter sp. 2RAF25]|uniref:type IV toxin-antitoxin system AbiEi family antitoxin domain-containing protein n=1 Tax=Terrabacter sp. 2RAF25 TaxID=3232998 RepID=UPI003F9D6B1B
MRLDLLGAGGVFSAADAAAQGLDGHALSRLVRAGDCLRLTRGWYAVAPAEPVTAQRRHALTATALGRANAARAVVSHHSTLILHGLPTYAVDLDVVHLTSLPRAPGVRVPNASTRRRGLVVHRPVPGLTLSPDPDPDPDPGAADPAVTTTVPPAWAVVQTGLVHGPESALVAADAALSRGIVGAEQLTRALDGLAGHPGMAAIRAALGHADGRHESPGETRTAYVLRCLGFDLEPQVELVAEGRRYRADFRVRGTRVLVEFDGAVKYVDRAALFAEKQREDALRRAGWIVVRVVWSDLGEPGRLRRRLATALAHSDARGGDAA